MTVSVRIESISVRDGSGSTGWSTTLPSIEMALELRVFGAGKISSAMETVERMLADPPPVPQIPQLGDALVEDPGNGVVLAGYKGGPRVRWARDVEGHWWPLSADYMYDGYVWADLERPVLIIAPNRTLNVEE